MCFNIGSAQINIASGGTVTAGSCGNTFVDSGGAGGNYSGNENYQITICPDTPGTYIQFEFSSFDVEGEPWDFLTFYEGTGTGGTVIGTYGDTSPPDFGACAGGTYIASSHPSGCITITFESDFIGNQAGWEADITCTTTAGGDAIVGGNTPPANSVCGGSNPFCADAGALEFENTSDADCVPDAPAVVVANSCLGSAPNPAWYFIEVGEAGDIVVDISQTTGPNGTGVGLDVDYVVWGPFNSPSDACTDFTSGDCTSDHNCSGTVVDCSYSIAPTETATIPNAQVGEFYMFLITNFNGAAGYITLDQTNTGNTGAGATDCCPFEEGVDPSTCGATDGAINISLLIANTSYTVNYTDPSGNPQSYTAVTDGNGTLQVPNLGAGTYTDIDLGVINCTPATITLGDSATPVLNTFTSNDPICSGEDAIFTLNGTPGTTISYTTTTNGAQTVVLDGAGNATITVTGVTADETMTITQLSLSGCNITLSNAQTVTLGTSPTADAATVSSPVCTGDDAVFTITGTPGATVNYTTTTDGAQSIVLDASGNATVTVTGVTADETITLVDVSSSSGAPIVENGINATGGVNPGNATGAILPVGSALGNANAATVNNANRDLTITLASTVPAGTVITVSLAKANNNGAVNITDGVNTTAFSAGANNTSQQITFTTGVTTNTITINRTGGSVRIDGVEYTLTPTGCIIPLTDSETVVVNPEPLIADTTAEICSESAFSVTPVDTLPDVVPAGTTYTWSAPVIAPLGSITGGSAQAVGQTSISQTLTNTTNAVATATYTVTATSGTAPNTCTDIFDIVVTVNPLPVVDTPADVTMCDSYTLPALTTGTYYTGSGGTGTVLNAGDAITSTQTIYVYEETGTTPNCFDEHSFVVTINTTPSVDTPADVTICDSYTLPVLTSGTYYTGSGGTGITLAAGTTITSTQTIYVYAETGTTPNCFDEHSFVVTINATPTVDTPSDVTICDSYTLPALTTGTYYTGTGGTGTVLNPGDAITSTQTIYVYEETGTTPNCFDEHSFVVTINTTPVVDTPADVTICDSYTLPALTTGAYYTGSGGTGTVLNAGDAITSTQTIYVYAETGTTPNCFDEHSFVVTISATPVVDTPADVTMCDSYTLPALTTGTYYTGAGGTGTVLNAGDAITSTQTIYVYAETGTTPNCFDEHSFVVTIGVTPTVDTPSDVTICDSYTLPVLTTGTYYTGTGGTGTVLNAGDAITSTQTIYVYAETGTTPNCFDEHSFVVTINATPTVDTPADVTMCDSYTLPALTTGTYYTGAGGTGTVLNAGDAITSTQTIYVYAETGTTPNCFDEHSFVVTIGVTPTVDAPSDVTICDSYTLPALTNGGYYTGPGGTGTMLNAGDAITSTQTIYVYEETGTTPNCFDENSFVVTINATPTVDAPSDVTICNEYILPALTSGTYYTGAGGTGTVLNAGDVLTTSQTIYVYEETGTTPNCFDEHSFVLTINVCTISVSVTADTPSICSTTGADVTLTATPTPGTAIGTYSYSWTVQGNATVLGTANTLLLSPPPAVTTTYEVTLTDSGLTPPNDTVTNTVTVVVNTTPSVDAPADVTMCDSYILPALTSGTYYTGAGGTGTVLSVGSAITSTQTIYVYGETGTTPNCTDENSFVVTINPTPSVDAPSDVTICGSYTLPALTNGTYYTGAGGTGAVLNAGDVITTTQTIYVYEETGTTPNCFDENSFVVTINTTPTVDAPANVTMCDSYILPALTNGTYYTGAGGTGSVLTAGSAVTSTQTIYVYGETGTTPNCTDENSFMVTINTTPSVDAPSDVEMCGSYTLPALTNGTYYTGTGGTGAVLNAGDVITSTQTIYVYAETGTTPNCFDENSFVVTINFTPNVDAPSDVTMCDSYILPALTTGTYYTGAGGTGSVLTAGSAITSTQTIYVYGETGTTPNCSDENSFVVTINTTPTVDTPADVTMCDSYTLPVLSTGTYYTGSGGTGTVLNAGDVLTTSQTIYVYAETGTTPNCSDEHSFVVTINATPTVDTPADITICDSYTLPTLTTGSYYTGTGGTGIALAEGTVITSTQTIYVYEETGTTPNCSDEHSFVVTINITPTVDTPTDVEMCDSYTLQALTNGTYYTGAGGTGTVLNAGDVITSTQTIYVYAETGTTPNCSSEHSFVVTVNPSPTATAIDDLEECDVDINGNPDNDGIVVFNLTTHSGVLLNGQANMTVSYFLNQADADANVNSLTSQGFDVTAYASGSQEIFVRVEDVLTGCYNTSVSFELIVNTINAVPPTDLYVCDDDNDGHSFFDLESVTAQIQNGNTALVVTYYETPEQAELGAGANIDTSDLYVNLDVDYNNDGVFDPQIIYIRVDDAAGTGCSYYGNGLTLTLNVLNSPDLSDNDFVYALCEDNNSSDGYVMFNLLDYAHNDIGIDPTLDIRFFENLDAAGEPINEIFNVSSYTNIVTPDQVIYMSVSNTSMDSNGNNCTTVREITLHVGLLPNIANPYPIVECDDDYYDDMDGMYPFDLDAHVEFITGGITGLEVEFYETQADALIGSGPSLITNTSAYLNTIYAGAQDIFARVIDPTSGCAKVILVALKVQPNPTPLRDSYIRTQLGNRGVMEECDGNVDGSGAIEEQVAEFDLTLWETQILTGDGQGVESGVSAAYYTSYEDAELGDQANAITTPEAYTNTSNPQTIFVRVTNDGTGIIPETDGSGCYTIVRFYIYVPVPEVSIEGNAVLCVDENGLPLTNSTLPVLTAVTDSAAYDFQWSLNGVDIPGATESTYTVTQAGEYTVTISGPSDFDCINYATTTIVESGVPDGFDANVTTTAFANDHQIQAEATSNIPGITFYYTLDLDPNTGEGVETNLTGLFTDVTPGYHTVTITDGFGCWSDTVDVLVIDYPHFFTPNGDGVNDTWKIIGQEGIPISIIYIFDRYGKLLKQIDPDGAGWDGTYNGHLMPAGDYWFTIKYIEGAVVPSEKDFKAHFSLKR